MAQKNFHSNMRALSKGEPVDVEEFWQALEEKGQETNAQHFCVQLLEMASQYDQANFGKKQREYMFATLLAVDFFKNRKAHNTSTLDLCRQILQRESTGHVRTIVQLFLSKKKQAICCIFMDRLVYAPHQINWNKNVSIQIEKQHKDMLQNVRLGEYIANGQIIYQKIKSISSPTQICPQTGELSLGYVCFMEQVGMNGNNLKEYQYLHLIQITKALFNFSKSSTQYQYLLTNFMHLIKNCVTFYGCPYQVAIKQLINCADHLRKGQGMVGEMGQQLFYLLQKQFRSPGSAFRKKLRQDFASLDMKQSTQLDRSFYLVSESEDVFGCQQQFSLMNLRKLIIWHILKASYLDDTQINKFVPMLKNINNLQSYQLYFKAMKLIQIASQMEVYQKGRIELKKNMVILMQQMNIKFQNDGKRLSTNQSSQFSALIANEDHPLNIFKYPGYEINHLSLSSFMNNKSKPSCDQIFKRVKNDQSLVFYRNKTSFVFHGTSLQWLRFINAISRQIQQMDVSQEKDLQFFYVPKPQPSYRYSISNYIAAHDLWYRRFVQRIFQQGAIFPSIQLRNYNKTFFPASLMSKSLNMYLREAKRIFPLRVYKCLIKERDSELETVYFTSYVMVGVFAEAEIIRAQKEKTKEKTAKYRNRDVIQIIKEKIKKTIFNSADLEIQWIQPVTQKTHKQFWKNIKFEDLQICNMPKQYFFGQKPNPLEKGLKLSILSENNARLFWKQLLNSQNFRENRSLQQISLAFRDIFINYTIKSLRIKNMNSDSLLRVMVDGVAYTKVTSFQIQSPLNASNLPLTIPICTFLPFY